VHVARVQAWRSRHPGYCRKARRPGTALQDVSKAQSIDSAFGTVNLVRSPLQEVITAQPAVLIGLIAHLVGTPLQEDIVRTTDRLLRLGRDILALSQSSAHVRAALAARSHAADQSRAGKRTRHQGRLKIALAPTQNTVASFTLDAGAVVSSSLV
jgi:predicted RNase H-like nuclease